jgi:NAD(P)-dependent dehydrogenase (short-subunit alcohol dehydrogenase family)/acyl carrier protein
MSQPSSKGPGAGSWLEAFQEIQRQTAEAHAAYQRAMADSHIAFLRTAEAASQHLHAVLTGQPLPQPQPRAIEPAEAPRPQEAPTWPVTEAPSPSFSAPPSLPPVVEQDASASATSEIAPTLEAPADASEAAAGLEVVDFQELLLEVVAEKTGYPREILAMEMGLEADLGIDSIKRVEILSTLKDRMPGLPEVDPSQIPNLQTLGQVLEFIEQHGGGNGDGGVDAAGGNGAGRSSATASQPATIERAVVRELPAPADGTSLLAGLEPGAAVAVVDGGELGLALADRLRERGLAAVAAADTDREVEEAEAVIYCGGLIELAGADEAIAISRRAFGLARRVAARLGERGGAFVTVQDTGGDFGLSGRAGERCWLCGLAGLAKTAALEWPRTAVRAIDLERGGRRADELARALEQELFDGGAELEVGLHADGTRTTLTCEATPASNGEIVVDGSSVLVVSGGGRGVTTATLLELARRCQPTLVLLGRTALEEEPDLCKSAADEASLMRVLLDRAQAEGRTVSPAELSTQVVRILAVREIRGTVAELERAGARARYLAVDVRDGEAVTRVLEQVRQELGPITGLIHAAGVLADKTIAEKTSEQFDRVFDTKVLGLRNLLAATAGDPLALLCLFSSVAGRFGNAGQADYAMANEILNRVAAAEALRREGRCLVRTIGWGPWEGGMVTPALQSYFRSLGVPLIPLELGARMLLDELGKGGVVEVLIGGLPVGGRPQTRSAAKQPEGAAALP